MHRTTAGILLLIAAGASAWADDGIPDLGAYTYAQREQAAAEVEWTLDAADARIERLRQRFGAESPLSRSTSDPNALSAVERERLQTGEWLREFRHPPPDHWDQFKSGMTESCARLFQALGNAEARAFHGNGPN